MAVQKHCPAQQVTDYDNFLRAFYKTLAYAGCDISEIQKSTSIGASLDDAIEVIDHIQAATTNYIKRRSFVQDVIPYQGALLGFQDVLLPIARSLRKNNIIPDGPIYLLLDDADNLTLQQTKILNTWVSHRSTELISLKISTQLRYKTRQTSSQMTIEAPHDYSEIKFTAVQTGSSKEGYPARVTAIVKKRLEHFGLDDVEPADFFPEDEKQAEAIKKIAEEFKSTWITDGRSFRANDDAYRYARPEYIRRNSGSSKQGSQYKYAGFDQLVHISSGIIRFFLEPAARMFSEQLRSNDNVMPRFIDPIIQDQEIRHQANEIALNSFNELMLMDESAPHPESQQRLEDIQRLKNLVHGVGALFRAHIMDEKASQRRLFSFSISDTPTQDLLKILNLGKSYGYFYEGTIGRKDGVGRNVLYVLTRRLAPAYQLDPMGFSGSLSLTSSFLNELTYKPNTFINRLRKDGIDSTLGDQRQLSLLGEEIGHE
jgi:hypothetical protein